MRVRVRVPGGVISLRGKKMTIMIHHARLVDQNLEGSRLLSSIETPILLSILSWFKCFLGVGFKKTPNRKISGKNPDIDLNLSQLAADSSLI